MVKSNRCGLQRVPEIYTYTFNQPLIGYFLFHPRTFDSFYRPGVYTFPGICLVLIPVYSSDLSLTSLTLTYRSSHFWVSLHRKPNSFRLCPFFLLGQPRHMEVTQFPFHSPLIINNLYMIRLSMSYRPNSGCFSVKITTYPTVFPLLCV